MTQVFKFPASAAWALMERGGNSLQAACLPLSSALRVSGDREEPVGAFVPSRSQGPSEEDFATAFLPQSAHFPPLMVLQLAFECVTTSALRQLGIKVLMMPSRQLKVPSQEVGNPETQASAGLVTGAP